LVTIRKDTPGHSVRDARYKHGCHAVDVSDLRQVLSIDPLALTARVEGQVLVGDLCRATLPFGLVPRVVPEFTDFTIAGLVCGEGIQSSSHRHGAFSHTVSDVEVALGDGSLVRTSSTEHADLFNVLPESLGTLGVVTSATVQLAPGARYVRSTYRAFTSADTYVEAFVSGLERSAFHEGVVFGPREYVLITADFTDEVGTLPEVDPFEPGSPYYYQHVRAAAGGRRPPVDVMRTEKYFARSTRGLWWMLECHAGLPLLTETRWGRRMVDRQVDEALATGGLASQGMTVYERERCLVHQDMGVVLSRLAEANAWVQQHLGVYPIWNCAVRRPDSATRFGSDTHLVDVGVYGEPRSRDFRANRDVRALQKFVDAPSLWGVSYLTWDELRASRGGVMELYEEVRDRYAASGAFPHVRDKVTWIDPTGPVEGPIPFWRLHRSFGPRWYRRPAAYATLALASGSTLVWNAVRR
jgi:delta24-sterol reductase